MWSRTQTLLPPSSPSIAASLSCIFNFSLLASAHPHLNLSLCHLIRTLYSPRATIYSFCATNFLKKLPTTSHSPFMPCNFASALPPHLSCSLHGQHQHTCSQIKWIYLSLLSLTSDSLDINDHSFLSLKIFF